MTPPYRAVRPRPTRLLAALLLVVAGLAACAPAAQSAIFDDPAAEAVDRVAREAYHRMEIGFLRTGVYTTNVLVDLDIPRGTRITVEAYDDTSYRLRVTSDAVPGAAWLVSPAGVERRVEP